MIATFTQAIESANALLADQSIASVNVEFVTDSGHHMTATVTRTGLENVSLVTK